MAKDDTEIVSALLLALADQVGAERFETWFAGQTRLTPRGHTLVVGVRSPFFQDFLRKNFRAQLEEAAAAILGGAISVTFEVDPRLEASRPADGAPPDKAAAGAIENGQNSLALHVPSVQESPAPAPPPQVNTPAAASPGKFTRRAFASFDEFIVGDSNRLARTAAEQILSPHGHVSPLVLCGGTGSGKTHLLEAIWVAARRRVKYDAVYVTGEQFATQFIEALNGRGLPSFRRKYRQLDLLLVDDLPFFANKRATQNELLQTLDALNMAGKQVVFACDRPLGEMRELQPELVARLQGGLCCRIDPPEYATRLEVVRRFARLQNVSAEDEVWSYVAEQIGAHARALQGAVKQLQIASLATGEPISRGLAERSLGELRDATTRNVRLADVEQAVCQSLGLEPDSLHKPSSSKRMQAARMLAMWLASKHTRSALGEIGEYFGLRSHSTVISAKKRVDRWLADQQRVDLGSRQCAMDEAVRQVERRLQVG